MIREGRLLKSLHQSPERYFSVADPDLQTGGGVGGGGGPSDKGGGYPDPEIMGREGRKSQKNFFQFGLKIRGGGQVPRPPPLELLFPLVTRPIDSQVLRPVIHIECPMDNFKQTTLSTTCPSGSENTSGSLSSESSSRDLLLCHDVLVSFCSPVITDGKSDSKSTPLLFLNSDGRKI